MALKLDLALESETDGSDVVPNHGIRRVFDDLFRVYTVPRVARIHAPPLQICYLITFTMCALAMLIYLVLTLQFLQFNDISISNSFLQLVPPWAEAHSLCYDYDYDCQDIPSSFEPAYCSQRALNDLAERLHVNFFENGTFSKARWPLGAPEINANCRHFDAHEALEEEGRPMVMTAQTMTIQDRCADPAREKCIWHNQGFKVDLVQNVEGFHLKIRHDVMAARHHASNAYSTGFVEMQGKYYQLHCASEGSCDEDDAKNIDLHLASCNMSECWSTKYADYVSMELVLKAANLSLDTHIPLPSEATLESGSDLPRRFLGASLGIDIKYENVMPPSLWPPSWYRYRNRYTYTFRKMGDYASETDISGGSLTRRLFVRKSGIKIFVSFDGQLATWSLPYAVKQLAIMQVVFALAMFVVNKIILNIVFRYFPGYTHLPSMKHYYAEYNSPSHHQFREARSAKQLHELVDRRDGRTFKDMRKHFSGTQTDSDSA